MNNHSFFRMKPALLLCGLICKANFTTMTAFEFLDYAGTAVFAISGALAAINKRFDLFGILILAAVTAIGGGTLRDVLIGRTPVGWMQNLEYVYIIFGATIITILFGNYFNHLRKTLFLFDSIGLALFTITGVELGLQFGLHPVVCVLLGTMTAAFGGVIRDTLSNEIPLIFKKEIYASISIIGGALFLLLTQFELKSNLIYIIISITVVTLRVFAVRFGWHLPKLSKVD